MLSLASKLTLTLIGLATLAVEASKPSNNSSPTGQPQAAPLAVQTTSGLLLGAQQPLTATNASIFKFLAVPYAEAPIGSLRFKKPVELAEGRQGATVDASRLGKTCPQHRHLARFISPLLNLDHDHQTSEDCLHLNIYVPGSPHAQAPLAGGRLEAGLRLPVIVWIPGEGFDFADARQFDGSYLALKTNSIVVTVQYRVGVLGFLEAPQLGVAGNMGLHDQIMALRWIKQNIGAFGGDSRRTTLMGRFSGSMTISALMTAPKQELVQLNGEHLFNRAALLSGVAVNDWIIEESLVDKYRAAVELAVARNYCNRSQAEGGSCLLELPVEQLLDIAGHGWKLVVDHQLTSRLGPIEAVRRNQIGEQIEAVLIGETGTEGSLCLYRHLLSLKGNFAQLIDEDRLTTDDLYEIIRDDSLTYFKYNISQTNPMQMALKALVGELEAEPEWGSRLRDKYLDACSSYMVKAHAGRFKRNLLARNELLEKTLDRRPVDVFHYELRYKPSFSLAPDYIKSAAHGDDIPLIFGLLLGQPRRQVNEADLLMTRRMMAYVGNFVHGKRPAGEPKTAQDDDLDGMAEFGSAEQRKNWSTGSQVQVMDFTESDCQELRSVRQARLAGQSQEGAAEANKEEQQPKPKHDKALQLRMVLVEGRPLGSPVLEVAEQEPPVAAGQFEGPLSRSQQLMELHRQQMLEERAALWLRGGRQLIAPTTGALVGQQQQATSGQQASQQQQQVQTSLANESSFATMLLLSACIVIVALMALCTMLSLIVFRCNSLANQGQGKPGRQFASSSSSCNICDDAQGASIEAVLAGGNQAKDGQRGLCSMFAKLRNQQHNLMAASNPEAAGQPTTNSPTMGTAISGPVSPASPAPVRLESNMAHHC